MDCTCSSVVSCDSAIPSWMALIKLRFGYRDVDVLAAKAQFGPRNTCSVPLIYPDVLFAGSLHWRYLACALLCLLPGFAGAQTGPTASPAQAPKTAPQVEQVLSSYEGQKVTSVELAGQPDLDTAAMLPRLPQRIGEPFSKARADETVAALKSAGFQEAEIEIRPEEQGVRVLF